MNIFEIEVHPAADIFPMIPKDELEELAADIKANGLIHPIVVKDNILIDGRNRRAACEIAGVEPEVVELNGDDINSFIISTNINRRHLTQSQQAALIARMYPSGQWKKKVTLTVTLAANLVTQARLIEKHLPGLAKKVAAGYEQLSPAYDKAVAKRDEGTSDDALWQKLYDAFPELAEQVKEGTLSIKAAMVEKKEREEKERATKFANSCTFRKMADSNIIFLPEDGFEAMIEVVSNPEEYKEFQKSDVADDIAKLDIIRDNFEQFYQAIKEAYNEQK